MNQTVLVKTICLPLFLVSSLGVPAFGEGSIVSVPTSDDYDEQGTYPDSFYLKDETGYDGSYERKTQHETEDGQFIVAIWESGPGTLVSRNYPSHEFGYILDGNLTIVNEDGSSADYGPGDSLVIPKGWNGQWIMHTRVRKQLAAYRDRDPE